MLGYTGLVTRPRISRRELLAVAGATAASAQNQPVRTSQFGTIAQGTLVDAPAGEPAAILNGRVVEPQRSISVLHSTDVLVVGGGPAGVCAAIAARRAGVRVTLVERYGYMGGAWGGGQVLQVNGGIVQGKKQVSWGIGEDILTRLDRLDRGIINRRSSIGPTVHADALRCTMAALVREEGLDVFLHSWCADAILEGRTVRGAVLQSKSGRNAILAGQVIDATGDGDLFAAAGAPYYRRRYRIGLSFRIGNLDKVDASRATGSAPPQLGLPTPIAGVNWINLMGPETDALDVRELTRMELDHRTDIWRRVEEIKKVPGYEQAYLYDVAPSLGVRLTRVLAGAGTISESSSGRKLNDCVGVGGSIRGDDEWQIPYGALVPKKIENLLAAGRCISGEPVMTDRLREIAVCFVSGHAAGCAAAIAVRDGCRAREVNVAKLQTLLRDQKAYLG
jgi:hypothetical protein